MTPLKLEQAVQACQGHSLYGPINVPDALDKVLAHPGLLDSFLYVLNMVDSRNLPWIDCILSFMASTGA